MDGRRGRKEKVKELLMSEPDADMENADWRKWECAAPFHSSLNKVQRDFRASALVLWKAFFSGPSPALAPAQFRLHTWHSEREASGQGRSGRAGKGGRGERESKREKERESCKSESEKQNKGRIGQKGDERGCRLWQENQHLQCPKQSGPVRFWGEIVVTPHCSLQMDFLWEEGAW